MFAKKSKNFLPNLNKTGIYKKELKIIISLASILSFRMLGLFMILPVFALYAHNYIFANEFTIGLAIGAYGASQALLQIPFGVLSDKIGRKKVILLGLGLLILGSIIAIYSNNIYLLILARIIQGSGAIGCVIMATLADNIREEIRVSSMAIIGMSIGMSFMLAIILGPSIASHFGLQGIFILILILSILAVFIVNFIPKSNISEKKSHKFDPDNLAKKNILKLFIDNELFSLYLGVFSIHAMLSAIFLFMPRNLKNLGININDSWQVYLVILFISFSIAWKFIRKFEKKDLLNKLLKNTMLVLVLNFLSFYILPNNLTSTFINLLIFFVCFSILESSLPGLVAKKAYIKHRGMILGIFSSYQFLGVFFGATIGGWLYKQFNEQAVLIFCMLLACNWLWVENVFKKRCKICQEV